MSLWAGTREQETRRTSAVVGPPMDHARAALISSSKSIPVIAGTFTWNSGIPCWLGCTEPWLSRCNKSAILYISKSSRRTFGGEEVKQIGYVLPWLIKEQPKMAGKAMAAMWLVGHNLCNSGQTGEWPSWSHESALRAIVHVLSSPLWSPEWVPWAAYPEIAITQYIVSVGSDIYKESGVHGCPGLSKGLCRFMPDDRG